MPETDTPTLTSAEPTQTEKAPKVEGLSTTEEPPQTETPEKGEETQEELEQRDPLSEGWQDHPDHLAVLETHGKESHDKGYQEAQSKFATDHDRQMREQRIKSAEEKQAAATAAESSAVVIKSADAVDAYTTYLEGTGVEPTQATAQLRKILADNAAHAEAFNGAAKKGYTDEGITEGKRQTSRLLIGGLNKDLTDTLTSFFEDVSLDVRDPQNSLDFNGAVDKILKERDKLVRADAETEINKLVKSRNGKEEINATHEGDKSAVEVGGRSGVVMKKYLDMTSNEREKLSDEQRDRAIARG